jgi:hypothetical protein
MKKLFILGSGILGLSLVILFFYFQKYSLNEITADNFKKKLKQTENSIWNCMLDDYIPDKISLWGYGSNFQIIQPIPVKVEIENPNDNFKKITVSNTPSSLNYFVVFKNLKSGELKVPIRCFIENYRSNPSVVKMLEKLIIERQFILMKSQLISGNDILIKENESDFIIIEMIRKYDFNNPPISLSISTYSRNRFF